MYQYLSGKMVEKTPTSVVIDIQGVGYFLLVPLSTSEALPEIGESIKLLTSFIVREDSMTLYGFLTQEEKSLFELLMTVSGIGPRMAISALSGIPLEAFKLALVQGKVDVLTKVPGIGKRTAERLIVELREKVVIENQNLSEQSAEFEQSSDLLEDSVEALMALGYKRANAKNAIEKVCQNQGVPGSVEALIRESLKFI